MNKEIMNCNFNAKNIRDINKDNILKYKEKITYVSLNNSKISNSSFKNCDIVACKLYDCTFINVDLHNADLISIQVYNCDFSNVIFDGTCIDDIEFINCKFNTCNFSNFSMKNCTFSNCVFYEFKPSCCLCELNSYIGCSFYNSIFTSSFHYQLFINCQFINTDIEEELLGYNYGLPISYCGNASTNGLDLESYVEQLYLHYLKQNLYTNALLLRINYEYEHNPSVILLWTDFLELIFKNNIIIKSNEIMFFKKIIIYMSNNNKISPLLLFVLNERLVTIYNKYCKSESKAKEDITLMINNLYFEFQKHMQPLMTESNLCKTIKNDCIIQISYIERPQKDLSEILNLFNMGYCKQIKTKNGSFHEWISCSENMLACLDIFLTLLGITVPIVYDAIKERKKKTSSSILDLSNCKQENVIVNITINNGCHILNDCGFVENNYYGYNDKNIQNINISLRK